MFTLSADVVMDLSTSVSDLLAEQTIIDNLKKRPSKIIKVNLWLVAATLDRVTWLLGYHIALWTGKFALKFQKQMLKYRMFNRCVFRVMDYADHMSRESVSDMVVHLIRVGLTVMDPEHEMAKEFGKILTAILKGTDEGRYIV